MVNIHQREAGTAPGEGQEVSEAAGATPGSACLTEAREASNARQLTVWRLHD